MSLHQWEYLNTLINEPYILKNQNEHITKLKKVFFLLAFCSAAVTMLGQVKGRVEGMSQPNEFKIIITPDQSWAPPNSITNTATITLKAPTDTFVPAEIRSYTGNWEVSNPIIAPAEAPNFDYFVFNLTSPLTNINYEQGIDLELFSFVNTGECTKDVQIIDHTNDPFLPPNSLNANIGNYFTILGNGAGNAYAESLSSSQLKDCNGIVYQLERSEAICSEDEVKARIIYQGGTPPMRAVLKKDDPTVFTAYIDTLETIGEVWTIPEVLEPGDYSLFMTDAGFDTVRQSFTIEEIEPLDITVVKEDIGCNDKDGALVYLFAKGIKSDESFSFKWSTGHTTDAVTGLRPGPYQVTLTNGKGCTTRADFEVLGIPPISINVEEVKHPTCPEKEDGYINVEVEGGVGIQYFYEWSDPELEKKWRLDNLKGGEYELTVADVSGCVGTSKIQLDIPPPIEPAFQTLDPTCPEFTDGSIAIEANEDGALPFTYSLNNSTPRTQTEYTELPSGEYDLLITDSRNCSKVEKVVLEEPEEFAVELGEDRMFLIGETKSLVTNNVLDDPSYQFEWFPTESLDCADCPNPLASPKETTTYSVIVTNEEGCYREDEVTININLDRPVFFPTAFSPNGDGNNDFFEIPPGKTTSKIVRLRVFARWGQLLYDSELVGGDVKWDGNFEDRPANEAVYIFSADILFADGQVLPFHGDVLLLR